MRVTVVHAPYSSGDPSGEDVAVAEQCAALERAGAVVNLVEPRKPLPESGSWLQLARAGARVATGSGENPAAEVMRTAPDIVHIHNLFPLWATNWLLDLRTPFVTSLHNYRVRCSKATLYRNGKFCDLCVQKTTVQSVIHGCYRESRVQTIPLAIRTGLSPTDRPEYGAAAALIALSIRSSRLFESMGLDSSKLEVIPNFCSDDAIPKTNPRQHGLREGWVFAGRLSEEKGLVELIENWPANEKLTVIGDGPLREWVLARQSSSLNYAGLRSRSEVISLFARSQGQIFPSKMTENSPMTFIESLAVGTPTVSLPDNTVADFIQNTGTGLVVRSMFELPSALSKLRTIDRIEERCTREFANNFSEGIWVSRIQSLYEKLLAGSKR